MPRTIAKVEWTVPGGTKALEFFGLLEVYGPAAHARREELVGEAYDAREYLDNKGVKKKASTSIQGGTKTTAKQYVAALAAGMVGKNAAYCDFGRERSAVAVFSFLYVKVGLSKTSAAEKVEQAVSASAVGVADETQRSSIRAQVVYAISGSVGFEKLPTSFGDG